MVEEHSRAKGICILASHQAFPLNGLKTLDLAEYTG
jgi:ABC-type transport system involved in cytochrome c biogenesis ATPase subunit